MTVSVSVVLPALNERTSIHDAVASLAAQDYPYLVEIVVVDGGSVDGTRELAAAVDPRVRVVDNPRVTAAAAMNIGIDVAVGEVIVRADAHTTYASDYVRRCVEVLVETGATNVGGPMRPVGTTTFGRAVAVVTTSPFGVGPGRFHYSESREEVDTVYLGSWRRADLKDLGGYDETGLQWAAEDQELNLRIRESGGRVVLEPSIRSWYVPRESPRALARQYFNYGVCKASTLQKHGRLPSWRPLAPVVLVGASVAGFIFGRGPARFAVPVAHAAACAVMAARTTLEPGASPPHIFEAVEICHWSYGLGFWSGLIRIVTGRGFTSRPRGHR